MQLQNDCDTINSDETVLSLIHLLKQNNGATVAELAEETGLAKSTIYRHLNTLLKYQYVTKTGSEYNISLRFLDLGGYARANNDVYPKVREFASRLAEELGEFVSFITEEHGVGVFLCIERQGVPSDARVGKRVYLHQSAAGKAILAHMNYNYQKDIIDRYGLPEKTENTVTDRGQLLTELDRIEERGYSYVRGDHTPSLWGVGVPVMHPEGRLLGGITVAGPAYRLRGERLDKELPQLLMGKMKEFELRVTYPTS